MNLIKICLILITFLSFSCKSDKDNVETKTDISNSKEIKTVVANTNEKSNYSLITQWKGDDTSISKLVLLKRNEKHFLVTEYTSNNTPSDYSDKTIGAEVATEDNKEFWFIDDTSHGFIIFDNGNLKNTNPIDNQTIYIKLAD